MIKIVVTALVLSTAIVACAINAKAQEVAAVSEPTKATAIPDYRAAVRTCGEKWRARAEKTDKGMDAWQKFRAACVLESGFKAKRPR